MAEKIFKGFRQVTEGNFEAETGYIYFVRNSANTGATDGYILFNGKMYGTAAEAAAELDAKIGTLPQGYSDLVSYINAQTSATTDGIEELSGIVGTIAEDYLTSNDITGITSDVDELSGIVGTIAEDYVTHDELTGITADITALSAVSAETRIEDLEAISADTRLEALEAISGDSHTHENKDVLDGISAEDVAAWDGTFASAVTSAVSASTIVISAYTAGDEGLTEGYLKTYEIFQGGSSVGTIDIPKDLVVSSGETVTVNNVKYLRLYIANDPEHPVDIPISDLAHVYSEGDGIEITSADTISVKVVEDNGLYLDENGINVAAASAESAGTMSSADFVKLSGVESGAQENVIEEVKVNGTALTITDKSVDIVLTGITGDIESLSAAVESIAEDYVKSDDLTGITGEISELSGSVYAIAEDYVKSDDLTGITSDIESLSAAVGPIAEDYVKSDDLTGITADIETLSGVSADTRITALEQVSADTRIEELEESVSALTADVAELQALTADTASALQSISAGDASVTVGTKDANNDQTVAVAISSASGNTLSLESDGLFAAIYYDGDDSE